MNTILNANVIELAPEFPYQVIARRKLVVRKKSGLLSCPGSGKTRILLLSVRDLGCLREGPIFVLCSGAAIATWIKEIPKWLVNEGVTSDDVHVVRGSPHKRAKLWRQAREGKKGFYITNYTLFRYDFDMIQGVYWTAAVCDEYNKQMRGHKTQTFKLFKKFMRGVKIVFWGTGTAMRKAPHSMWTLFHMCAPHIFTGYWKFVYTFCIVNEGMYGKEILGPKNVDALKKIMDMYLAYIPKEVVADQLPEGMRISVPIEMTTIQARVYKELQKEMMLMIGDSLIITPTVLAKIIKLRQLLCCPRILDPSLDFGGGFEYIMDTLDEQPHVIIFVPFRPACDWIQRGLIAANYKHVYILRGGVTPEEQIQILSDFARNKGIIVCTIAYAESFDAETCDTSWFLGYDYSLDINEQAEGRTQRAISKHKFVRWNYLCYSGTIDEDNLQVLNVDHCNVARVLNRPQALIQAMKGEIL